MRTAVVYNFLIEANMIAGVAIVLMMLVRRLFRGRIGNRALCIAWLLVAIRLLCPLSLPNPLMNEIASPYHHDPAIRPIAGQIRVRTLDALSDAQFSAYRQANSRQGERVYWADLRENNFAVRTLDGAWNSIYSGRAARTGMIVYLAGAGITVGWFVFRNIRCWRLLKKNRVEALSGELLEEYRALCARKKVRVRPVYWVDPLPGACLVGVFRPYIALPLAVSPQQARQMLLHEACHDRAKDPLWTLLSLLCCAVHWFNPLVWTAASMCRMDRELRCDDQATRDMGDAEKQLYAGTLIQAATRRAAPGMCVLMTGMSMTGRRLKTRVSGILHGKKPVKALSLAFVAAACLLLILAFGTGLPESPSPILENDRGVAAITVSPNGPIARAAKDPVSYIPLISDEAALENARHLWQSPYLQESVQEAEWQVRALDEMYLQDYEVEAYLDSGFLHANFMKDGRVDYLFNAAAYAQADQLLPPASLSEKEIKALVDYALDGAEALMPGVTKKVRQIRFSGVSTDGTIKIAEFDLICQEEDLTVSVQYAPKGMRIVQLGTGNG